jgi:hypothetical protein
MQVWPENDGLLGEVSGRSHGLNGGERSEAGTCAPASWASMPPLPPLMERSQKHSRFYILDSGFFSLLYGRRSTSKDEGDNEQNQKDDEQHVGDPRRFTGHTA